MPPWLLCHARTAFGKPHASLCILLAAAVLSLFQLPARADDLAAFNAAIEDFASHNRVAIGYLRTGNDDLAAVELQKMKASWGRITAAYGTAPPAALKKNPRFSATMTGVGKQIADALALLNTEKQAKDAEHRARRALEVIREQLSAMRRASKITVLADCVLEANGAMAAIFMLEHAGPDFGKTGLGAKANTLEAVIRRCDAIADADTRRKPEFRRLIDGTLNSLTFIPKVITNKDSEMLVRVIGELRAFDNLLLFRFG